MLDHHEWFETETTIEKKSGDKQEPVKTKVLVNPYSNVRIYPDPLGEKRVLQRSLLGFEVFETSYEEIKLLLGVT